MFDFFRSILRSIVYTASHPKLPLPEALADALAGMITVISVLMLLMFCVLLFSKIVTAAERRKAPKNPGEPAAGILGGADSPAALTVTDTAAPAPPAKPSPAGRPLPETQSQGKLTLIETDETTAAILMAIVSHQSGIPLNRLVFHSIRLLH
ncbi:MAG: OadG family protein [Oscillospiraceae bacterium]|jgi:Na+-transporting methylmalonyl-CoA/oxaloacetate decarboxylase gamma subunit|nr:OadG family protein [Oscillospiraceae bacterium]